MKPPSFRRIIFQSAVQSADFQSTGFQLVVVDFILLWIPTFVGPAVFRLLGSLATSADLAMAKCVHLKW
ncbi:hypothetical protein [Desulfonema ishimotonii]|uniref:hypothetical protein n=1 Tax=Desulfonema ishimotonii TaxID=45657 RepID=UPI000F55A90C|nr:hypothetical protein [Desulfonema ishimotonii]